MVGGGTRTMGDTTARSFAAERERGTVWRPMKFARWAFAVVPLVALLELGAHLYFAVRPPTEAQWRAAAPRLAALRRPHDLVVIAPQWAEPVARMVLGDDVMPVSDVARPDETRYATAMEISILGERSKYTKGWPQIDRQTVGKFVVRHLQNPQPATILYDFVEHVDPSAATALLRDGSEKPCPWSDHAGTFSGGLGGPPAFPSHRFVCPAPLHVFVGVTIVEDQTYLPRRCIMMHVPMNGSIEARFRDVPLGAQIHGHSGMRMIVERESNGTPILLEVFVDGAKVGEDTHVDGEFWKSWTIPTPGYEGKRGEVMFRVSSAHESQRQMCWEADTR